MWTNVIPLDFKIILRCFIEIKGIIGKIPPLPFLSFLCRFTRAYLSKNLGWYFTKRACRLSDHFIKTASNLRTNSLTNVISFKVSATHLMPESFLFEGTRGAVTRYTHLSLRRFSCEKGLTFRVHVFSILEYPFPKKSAGNFNFSKYFGIYNMPDIDLCPHLFSPSQF